MTGGRRTLGLSLALLCACTGIAGADDDASLQARTHYRAGEALYNLHNYTDAIREFSSGYALAPLPAFLLNLGQAYRMRDHEDDLERAREMYHQYLEQTAPDDKQRDNVTQVLAEIDRKIGNRPRPQPQSPPVVSLAPAVPAAALVAEPPPPSEKKRSKAPAVVAVTLIVAAVAAGVALGVYFGMRSSFVDCGAAALGCIDASR